MTDTAPEPLATVPTADAGAQVANGTGDLDIVRIYNEELDAYGESPRAGVPQLNGWVVVDPTPAQAEQLTTYDPAAHSRDEVLAHFETISDTEVDAIKVLEQEGPGAKNRKTVLEWERQEPESSEG